MSRDDVRANLASWEADSADYQARNQLAAGRANVRDTGARMPLVRASAEEIPFADESFDLVFCDHGATSFTDPEVAIPEAARVLRYFGGGRTVWPAPDHSVEWQPEHIWKVQKA